MRTQKEHILLHMKSSGITPLDALRLFGCFRLAAVIFDLRDEGYTIITEKIRNGNGRFFARYKLVQPL